MATMTLTVPASGTPCNGEINPREPIQVTVMYAQSGILGWKKRTLYLLLILLVSVVVINMTLILWIIKILDLTSAGPGNMRIFDRGIHLESGAEFLDTLTATQIVVSEHQSLKLESARNVTFIAKNSYGDVTNFLSLGGAGFQAVGRDFSVRSKSNDILLHVDSREMVVSANNIIVSNSGGFRLDGSLETPLVRGSASKDLRLESVLKRVKVRSEKEMHVDSPAGGIFVTGLKNMNLRSTGGKVTVDSSRLQMRNLKTASQIPKEDDLMMSSKFVCVIMAESFWHIDKDIAKYKNLFAETMLLKISVRILKNLKKQQHFNAFGVYGNATKICEEFEQKKQEL